MADPSSPMPPQGPEELLVTARKFRLVTFEVTDPQGQGHTYHVMRHPGAACIVPWTADGRILLVRQPRVAIGRPLLEIPAGTLDPGEDPETCARRELEEETGFRAATWRRLAAFWPSPGVLDERMWLFEARDLETGTANPDPDEELTNVPVAPSDVAGLVAAGEIADAKTLVGLALVGVELPSPGF